MVADGVRGRVALVAGGTGGIDSAICRGLASDGRTVSTGGWVAVYPHISLR